MAPVVHGLQDLYGDQITFHILDITPDNDQHRAKVRSLGLALSPTGEWGGIEERRPSIFLLSPSGRMIGYWYYFTPGERIQKAIVEAIVLYY